MEDQELQNAQRRLEERQGALSKPISPEQISFHDEASPLSCPKCGGGMRRSVFMDIVADVCPPCSEIEERRIEAEEREQRRNRIEKAKQERIVQQLKACSVGERFMGMTFDDYKPTCAKATKVLDECKSYVSAFQDQSGANVLMVGSPGTGKNMLAAIICQEIIKRDFSCLHTTAMKLVRRVKDSWRNKENTEQEVIDSFVVPSLLVIDEIGVQFGSPTEQLYLTEIINERYEKRRPTILISNLKLSQLSEIMGERVIDRFYDDGSKMLAFDWASYRRRGV